MTPSRDLATTTESTIGTTAEVGPRREIDTVLVKTSSRCNLDCGYCYVYHLGDEEWANQPRRMTPETQAAVVRELGMLSRRQTRPLSVVLHGGEPLLLGYRGIEQLLEGLRASLRPDAGLHIQTNGLLLTDEYLALFDSLDVGVSISFDGPAAVHDLNRTDHRGRGSHSRVVDALELIQNHPAGKRVLTGLLAVVDPSSDPIEVYESLKATGTPSFDFLYRDGHHDQLPPGKSGVESIEYGSWMSRLFDHYLADPSPPRVRVIDDLMRLVLGGYGQKEGVGTEAFGILVIDTDGTITRNDTLKVSNPGADRFEVVHSIHRGFDGLFDDPGFVDYLSLQWPTSEQCRVCPELHVCGGGMPAHRWSERDGYNNPTVFCADQLTLIGHIRSRLGVSHAVGATGS